MAETRRELTPDELIDLQDYFKECSIPELQNKVIKNVAFTQQRSGVPYQTLVIMFAYDPVPEQAPASDNAEATAEKTAENAETPAEETPEE